ncbi:MAG: ferritin [Saprospiraceae bacterium]|nr:ferritin [Saprospiraceae bacterium]
MLKENVEKALNNQIAMEGNASFFYLSMASWCEQQGLEGSSEFFYRQAEEEHEHMMRIFRYVLEMDGKAASPAISKAPDDFASIQDIFSDVYQHEQKVTQSINELVNLSAEENDHTTYQFLQWFVVEQREEETLIRSILDRLKLIGSGPQSLYFIDKEITDINRMIGDSDSSE